MTRNDFESAFPRQLPNVSVPPDDALRIIQQHAGMSMRDWFAGMALMGFCANRDLTAPSVDSVADYSYRYADAMLREREKGAKE